MPDPVKRTPMRRSIGFHLLFGVCLMLLAGGGMAAWGINTQISGAVIANGRIVVESNSKKVQHPTGGVVGELLVRNGDSVKSGDVLLRLDATQTRANLAIIRSTLDELLMRQARLDAEKENRPAIAVPADLSVRQFDLAVARLVEGEEKLFQLRKEARDGQKGQLLERVTQLEDEIRGLEEQRVAKDKEIALIKRELEGVNKLWQQQLIQITRLMALEREAARLEGQRGQYVAAVAQARGKIAETRLGIIQVDQDLRSTVAQELSEVRGKISEYKERLVAAEDQLKRIELRAPQSGVVHQLNVHTIGGVIGPGEAVMLIVPQNDSLVVEARVAPQDIDQIYLDQPVALRFTAFKLEETPELTGSVSRISADLTIDEQNNDSFYLVRVALPVAELKKLGDLALVPGMPVEAFVKTEDRTVMSYLVKPLTDQVVKAFRD